ncbi:MAG: hypothetical protein PHS44_01730 [Candidatus Dojkabacteria bacterium]|nr:hypothetical protein [Candidatus Dojkabacteria bacterium]
MIDTPVAVQLGVQFLQEFIKWLGIRNVIFRTGALVYGFDDHYYLLRTQEEGYQKGIYYVGDMGEWSKMLPSSYNNVAPWNAYRERCRYF